jgi:hypothetical protein
MRWATVTCLLLTASALLLPGCSRMRWETPTAVPREEEPDMGYMDTAEQFLQALVEGRPAEAHKLLTVRGREAIKSAVFVEQFGELSLQAYRIVADVSSGENAYVISTVDAATLGDEQAPAVEGFGLLLRRAEPGWRVGFVEPLAEVQEAYPNLRLERSGREQFLVTYSAPDGTSHSVSLKEL